MNDTNNNITEVASNLPVPVAERGISGPIWRTLKTSIFPGAESTSVLMAWDYCAARKLDILKKPVHIVPMPVRDTKTGQTEWRDIIMPGIAEYRITATRTGEYAGQDEAEYGEEITHKGVTAPCWCRITVYRFVKNTRVSFTHKEFFVECVGTKKSGQINSMWTNRPIGQMTKTTEAGALRKAFPEEFGAIISNEETQEIVINEEQETVINGEVDNKDIIEDEIEDTNDTVFNDIMAGLSSAKNKDDLDECLSLSNDLRTKQKNIIQNLYNTLLLDFDKMQ